MYKKMLKRATIAFVCLLVFLTFFANTLADISLPRVVLAFAGAGTITTFGADGTAATTRHAYVVPITALRQDPQGYFVLYVESVPQRLGSQYYLRMLRVEPSRRDFTHVAIRTLWGDMPHAGMVVNSDIPVFSSARVRIVGDV
jgi:hypothetical protein